MKPLTNEAVAKKKDTALSIVKALANEKVCPLRWGICDQIATQKGHKKACLWIKAKRFLKQSGGKGK
jgi:hypothetical protein